MSDNATPPVSPHKRERDTKEDGEIVEPAAKKARVSPPRSPSAHVPATPAEVKEFMGALKEAREEIVERMKADRAHLEETSHKLDASTAELKAHQDALGSLKEQLQARIEEGLEREARLKDQLEAQAREAAQQRKDLEQEHLAVEIDLKAQLAQMRRERDTALETQMSLPVPTATPQ